MISCTEFIPAYSELFTYLAKEKGRAEVDTFWAYLFEPDGKGIPLINFLEKEGIRGCYTYWSGSLNEEAADFSMYVNEKRGFFLLDMHRCPSKGRLLQLKETDGVTPFPDYCLHCDYYRHAVEKAGFKYIYNFSGMDKAACSILIYDPKIFDGRVILDEDTTAMHRSAGDNEYFHKDFHNSMNMGVEYLGSHYGTEAVEEYLRDFTNHVYGNLIKAMQSRGLAALQEKILDTYQKEKALDKVQTTLTEKALEVEVSDCPAVAHLRATGRNISSWYVCTTTVVMEALAEKIGAKFSMDSYDEETGKASYRIYY